MVSQYEHGPDFQTPNEAEIQRLEQLVYDMGLVLKSAAMWIGHWQEDVTAGLKPTPTSLTVMRAEIEAALSRTKGGE